ncbi:MAG: YdcF family protein [Acetobacteraceae bacterium]|nr:YdcF family protein [Acetobacteraceae bacterium]
MIGWSAGFLWFIAGASAPVAPAPRADGIVALTGGADRVERAFHLLAEGRGQKLLLSGIGGGAELRELARRAGLDPAPLAHRVTLGRSATTTHGNALETAGWAQDNGIHSLIVVTAGYHMPRALAELSRVLPDVELYPAPVLPPALRDEPFPADTGTLRLMAAEYTKWLATEIGISGLWPSLEPRPARLADHADANPARTWQ